MSEVLQSTTRPIKILMVDSTDLVTGLTGLTITAKLAKSGLASGTVSPTSITDRGDGIYEVSPLAAHRDTLGESSWVFSATGAVNYYRLENVVAVDVRDATAMGLSRLDAAITTRNSVTPPTVLAIADQVWDEIISGGSHNTSNSSGKILRLLKEAGGYTDGNVYIDTVDGTAGSTPFENGTENSPTFTLADALLIANDSSVNAKKFKATRDSIIAPIANFNNFTIDGTGYTFTLGGHDYAGTHVYHASPLSGAATSTANTDHMDFIDCIVSDVTVDDGHFTRCGFSGTVTLSGTGTSSPGGLKFIDCHSLIAGTGTPIFDFGTGSENHDCTFAGWQNGIEIRNFNGATTGGTDKLSISGTGQIVIAASCDGGTINLRGQWRITDNSGGAVTILQDDVATETTKVFEDVTGLNGGAVVANVTKLNGDAAAAANLARSAKAIIPGKADPGTLTVTQMTTDISGYADDKLVGRVLLWTSGNNRGLAVDIIGYVSIGGLITYAAIATAPAADDEFTIV